MRSLSMSELGQVSGGLIKTSPTGSGLGGSGTKSGSAHSNLLPPAGGGGGYGGGGYAGYLGGIGNIGGYVGDPDFFFGSNYASTYVAAGDRVEITSTETNQPSAPCVLQTPSGSDLAWGTFELVGGTVSVLGGVVATLGTDGIAAGFGYAGIAFGIGDIVKGAGNLELKCKTDAVPGAEHGETTHAANSHVEIA